MRNSPMMERLSSGLNAKSNSFLILEFNQLPLAIFMPKFPLLYHELTPPKTKFLDVTAVCMQLISYENKIYLIHLRNQKTA